MIRKVVLLEAQTLLGYQKNGTYIKPTTINEVVTFYSQLRDKFKFEISCKSITSKINGWDETKILLDDMLGWINENNILAYRDRGKEKFYFLNEEDAVAFKLKWL